jgi:hypothetical protein
MVADFSCSLSDRATGPIGKFKGLETYTTFLDGMKAPGENERSTEKLEVAFLAGANAKTCIAKVYQGGFKLPHENHRR